MCALIACNGLCFRAAEPLVSGDLTWIRFSCNLCCVRMLPSHNRSAPILSPTGISCAAQTRTASTRCCCR